MFNDRTSSITSLLNSLEKVKTDNEEMIRSYTTENNELSNSIVELKSNHNIELLSINNDSDQKNDYILEINQKINQYQDKHYQIDRDILKNK